MKHINYSKKIGTFIVSLALTTMLATSIWAAGYSIKGNLSVNVHIVPILKDNATAYTSVSRPSKNTMIVSLKQLLKFIILMAIAKKTRII